jgi:hypothetical protein
MKNYCFSIQVEKLGLFQASFILKAWAHIGSKDAPEFRGCLTIQNPSKKKTE